MSDELTFEDPATLVEWADNPRVNADAVGPVARSIERFGFGAPIVARPSDRRILAGHTRIKAAHQLGLELVPVRWLELDDQEAAALSVADNAIGERYSTWDDAGLADVLHKLRVEVPDLAKLTGFDDKTVNALLRGAGRNADGSALPEVDPDEPTDPPPENPITQLGDLWILGDHRLLCGDATSPEDVGRLLDGAVPHLMVTDPPYGVNYDPQWRQEAADKGYDGFSPDRMGTVPNDDRTDWTEAWGLFGGDVAYVWCAGSKCDEVVANIERTGLERRSLICWAKPSFAISRGHYHNQMELLWYAVRKGETASWSGNRAQSTVWQISNVLTVEEGKTNHGTQKPVECMERPMRNHEGDAVYDPFCGSGTTLIAAERQGRNAFCLEISPDYCDVAVHRWESYTGQKAQRIPREEQLDPDV